MKIVHERIEFGHRFQVEELDEPRRVGASERRFRLHDNGSPLYGRQWHYSLDDALAAIEYSLRSSYVGRIEWLELRVNLLQRENHLLKTGQAVEAA